MNSAFQPKVLAFLCNWCAYAGADLAGVSRIQYPPFIRVVRTMCSGRVDPLFVIHALDSGYDGVFVGGCHIGDCHYQDGNRFTQKRMELLATMLADAGIGADRLHLRWASAAEGQAFADHVSEVTAIIQNQGPFDAQAHRLQLAALARALGTRRLRWLVGVGRQLTEKQNVYAEKTTPERFAQVMTEAAAAEYQKALLLEVLGQGPETVKGMAARTGLPVHTVSRRLNELERSGLADLKCFEGTTPRFACVAG
jgi:F420-non-reducing hydrogenase iron-sulfur subunit